MTLPSAVPVPPARSNLLHLARTAPVATRPPRSLLAWAIGAMLVAPAAHAQDAELRARIEQLERQVQALQQALAQAGKRAQEANMKADALASQQEGAGAAPAVAGAATGGASPGAPARAGGGLLVSGAPAAEGRVPPPGAAAALDGTSADESSAVRAGSYGAQASATEASAGRVTVFGYGEINYNRPRDASLAEVNVRRAVIGFGYRFDPRLRLVSEFEFEHAVTSATDPGEVAVEQLYLDYALVPQANVKAGLFLLPIGLLNEVHEPTRYFGVERNDVETRVIPTTWREVGVGVYGQFASGLYYDVGLTSGFNLHKWDATEGPSAPLASIHQEGARASAHDIATYAAVRWLGVPGVRLGTGIWSGRATQGNGPFRAGASGLDLAGIGGRVTLWDAHAVYARGPWDLRALYARGRIGNAGAIDDVLASPAVGQTGGFVPSSFDGWYAQAAYTVWQSGGWSIKPFARYERYDLQRSMPAGFESFIVPGLRERVITAGASVFVSRNAVLKLDWQRYQADAGRDRFNVGLGYAF